MLALNSETTSWLAGIAFFAGLVLTIWPRRWCSLSAAALYVVGILTYLGFLAHALFIMFSPVFGSSDPAVKWRVIIPIGLVIYAVGTSVLLWRAVPQRTALLWGKILHLCILPPLVLFLLAVTRRTFEPHPFQLQWLIYGLLWFRIREGYAEWIPNQHLQPTPR